MMFSVDFVNSNKDLFLAVWIGLYLGQLLLLALFVRKKSSNEKEELIGVGLLLFLFLGWGIPCLITFAPIYGFCLILGAAVFWWVFCKVAKINFGD